MAWPLRPFFATLLIGGLVLGSPPRASAPHCEATSAVPASHHDDHGPKDTEQAQQCPHCPAADCQRHSQCAFGVDLSMVDLPPMPGRPPEFARYRAGTVPSSIVAVQPPTPPPQATG